MTVEQFDPSTSNSNKSQTTTLDIPSKMIEEQHNDVVNSNKVSTLVSEKAAKVGFVSLGCPKAEGQPKL
ncbi:hypothetical protein NBRC116592_34440 [Colwellia sp. KU-HH00111]|uniref:hypothetical protein n=1 Tax=Colwellia sp. KU-HH00111 TaxID=3127652 RepID=UPI00310740E8